MKAVTKLLGLLSGQVVTHEPVKGDIRSCAKYARSIAKRSDKPQQALNSTWIEFINRSYLGKSQKIGGAK